MNSFLVVLKKELKDIFRDKKTILFTIIVPIILFPVMYKLMGYGVSKTMSVMEEEINVAFEGDTSSSIYNILQSQKNIKIKDVDNPKAELKDGKIQLIVNVPKDFDKIIASGKKVDLDVLYDDSSNNSAMAVSLLENLTTGLKDKIVNERLSDKGIDTSFLEPFNLNVQSGIVADGEEAMNPMARSLGGMMPSLIIVFMFAPVLGIAADLGAGEKEKNTFEPLLSTPCDRNFLIFGKIGAISVVSTITMIASLFSMYIGLQGFMKTMASASGHAENSSLAFDLSPQSLIVMIVLLLILLLAICAIQISISIFARSSKEAGTYLSGVITPIMIISYIPMFMDAKSISSFMFHIPVANSVALMKELMVGITNYSHIGIVLFWNIIYLVLAILATKWMFSREEVVFRS